MKPYFVYIIKCADGTLYTGITTDVTRRLRQHNGELVGGAKYTAMRKPVALVYQSEHYSRSEACIEESRIKKLTRPEKEKMIQDKNPK